VGLPGAKKEVVIVIGTIDPVIHLDPAVAYEFMSCEVCYNIFDTLVKIDPKTGKIVPCLAEKWEISPDGKVWTFYLRKGVKFHDGRELTAEDVKYSIWNRAIVAKTEPSWMIADLVEKIEVADKYTVKFYLKAPYAMFLPVLAFTVCAPVSSEAAKSLGEKFDMQPVGTGPFKVVKFVPDQYLILEKFKDYWGEKPKVDKIIIKFYKDAAALKIALEKREVDIAFRHIEIEDLIDLAKNPNYKIIKGDPPFIRYLVINTKHIPDKTIRQAIAYAIDKDTIVNEIFKGYAKKLYSLITPSLAEYYKPVFKKYDLDRSEEIAKAKELMAKAGYSETKKFKVTLWYTPSHYGSREAYVADAIKKALEETGVFEVEVKYAEWGTYRKQTVEGLYDMSLYGWYPDYMDPDDYIFPFLHSTQTKWLGCFYSNSKMDKLIEKAKTLLDPAERKKVYDEIQDILAEDCPIIPLWVPVYEYVVVYWKDVEGVNLTPEGIMWFNQLYKPPS